MNRATNPLVLKCRHMSMEEFDALPRAMRDALNYAAFKYSCVSGIDYGFYPERYAECLRQLDAEGVQRAYLEREGIAPTSVPPRRNRIPAPRKVRKFERASINDI